MHARPAIFHMRGMFQNNVDISIGFGGEAGNGCAADMLDAFGDLAQQRFETVLGLAIEARPISIIWNDLDERPHLQTSGLGAADRDLVHA
nr:hypothetical protein [Agrobacterium cavarae]